MAELRMDSSFRHVRILSMLAMLMFLGFSSDNLRELSGGVSGCRDSIYISDQTLSPESTDKYPVWRTAQPIQTVYWTPNTLKPINLGGTIFPVQPPAVKGKNTAVTGEVWAASQYPDNRRTYEFDVGNTFTTTQNVWMKFYIQYDNGETVPIFQTFDHWTLASGEYASPPNCNIPSFTHITGRLPIPPNGVFQFPRKTDTWAVPFGELVGSGGSSLCSPKSTGEIVCPRIQYYYSPTVQESRDLKIIFVKVGAYGELGPSFEDFFNVATQGRNIAQGIFPVREGGVHAANVLGVLSFDPKQIYNNTAPIYTRLGSLLNGENCGSYKCAVIGVVQGNATHTWFEIHGMGSELGEAECVGCKVGLAESNYFWVAVHELMHMFGVSNCDPCTTSAYGWWIDLPGSLGDYWNSPNIMAPWPYLGYEKNTPIPDVWIATKDYATLVSAFSSTGSDPEIIFVRATISNTGAVALQPWYRISSGFTSSNATSPQYRLVYQYSNGTTIANFGFNATFQSTEFGVTVPSNPATVDFWAPWYSNAAKILIESSSGTALATRSVPPHSPVVSMLSHSRQHTIVPTCQRRLVCQRSRWPSAHLHSEHEQG